MPTEKIAIVNSKWRELALDLLRKITSNSSHDIPLGELLQLICDTLSEVIPASAVAIEPISVGKSELLPTSAFGKRCLKIEKNDSQIDFENTLSNDVSFRHATLILTDIPNENFVASKLLPNIAPIQTYIGTPIYVNRVLAGVISVACTESVILTSESATWLEAIANALGSNLSIRKNLKTVNKSEKLAHGAIHALGAPIAVLGPENLLVMYNQSWELLMNSLGVESKYFKTGKQFSEIIAQLPEKNSGVAQLILAGIDMIAANKQQQCKLENVFGYVESGLKDKEIILSVEITAFPQAHEILIAFQDITGYVKIQEQLDYDSRHDKSTGLPNKLYLQQRLELAIQRSFRYLNKFGILYISLERFQNVIDSLGHKTSDEIAKSFSERLKEAFHPSISLARINSDEFVLIIETMHEEKDLIDAADRVTQCLSKPFISDDTNIHLNAKIGIAISDYSNDSITPDTLLRNAHEALSIAQKSTNHRFHFYNQEQSNIATPLLKRENELRDAIDNDDLVLYYQPEIDLATGELVGMEALIRWNHKHRGIISPIEFIPLAEETGLITPIFDWVLNKTVSELANWPESNSQLKIWINASAHQFTMSNLASNIKKIVNQYNASFQNLGIEITESVVMEDAESSIETLKKLRELGLSLSIDDFGTGYSSLAYLRKFPIDIVKIDRTFIDGLGEREDNDKIVNAVIAMVHELGLKTLAEGIEEESQLNILQKLGCEYGQGYLFSKPIPEFSDPNINYLSKFSK